MYSSVVKGYPWAIASFSDRGVGGTRGGPNTTAAQGTRKGARSSSVARIVERALNKVSAHYNTLQRTTEWAGTCDLW